MIMTKLLTDCAHLLQLFEWSGPELVGKIKGGNLYHGDPKAPHVRPTRHGKTFLLTNVPDPDP
jgi:hypothetical protein